MKFMIRDRLSFMRFLGLGLNDTVPDAKTIWLFRERLKEKEGGSNACLIVLTNTLKLEGCLP